MPRRLSSLSKGAPAVESTLDDFISRANSELVDVGSGPTPTEPPPDVARSQASVEHERAHEAREQALEKQVEALQQRILAMKAKRKPSQGWGKLVIGFVLGCGAMFAVSAVMPKDEPAPKQTTAVTPVAPIAAPAVAPAPPPPPPAKIDVTPIEPPPPAPVAPPVAETPPPVEAVTTPPAATSSKKPTKKAHTSSTASASQPKDPPKPPDKAQGSDTLYNPF